MENLDSETIIIEAKSPIAYRSSPVHINKICTNCKTKLVLWDNLVGGQEKDNVWYDEWICPKCQDGIQMDWPNFYYLGIDWSK